MPVLCIKYRHYHICILRVPTAFKFLLLALLESLDVFRGSFLVLTDLFSNDSAVVIVLLANLLHLGDCSLCNLAVALELL